MTARDVIAQALALSEAATPGPWTTRPEGEYPRDVLTAWSDGEHGQFVICEHARPDDEFIAAARALLPALAKALGDVLDLADGCENVARNHADQTTRDTHRSIALDLRAAITAALSEVTP